MITTSSSLPEILIIEPQVLEDDRGYFFESFNQRKFEDATGLSVKFCQDNESKSTRGVLRGLHFQTSPMAQGKLIRVSQGEVFDVAVDIRYGSPTFGYHSSIVLSAENKKQVWIPRGFAHGFLSMSASVILNYKTDNYYSSQCSRSIAYDDLDIGINWPVISKITLSSTDKRADSLKSFPRGELPAYRQ